MTGWPAQELRKLISIEKGKKAQEVLSSASTDGHRYLQIEDLRSNTAIRFCKPYAGPIARPSDVIIAWDGANAGTVSYNLEGQVGSTLAILSPSPTVLGAYLARYLQSKSEYLQKTATGATIPHVSKDALLGLEISVPPLEEQERLVKLLDEADALRKLRAEADRHTAGLIPALFHDMFGRSNFPISTVGDLAEPREGSIRTGPFGSDLRHSEFVETGVPVLGIDNVVANEFRWTKPRCISAASFQRMNRFRVFPGDVIVTIMGTVGRCAVAPSNLPICISTKHLCVISPDRKLVESLFLWAALLFAPSVRDQTRVVGKGAIMDGWNSTVIKRLSIPVPSLRLQKQFAARVADIRAMEAGQRQSKRRLDDLFQSMLHRAFAGDL